MFFLSFQNLEIANLKQKILDITKHNIVDISVNAGPSVTNSIRQEKTTINEVKTQPSSLQPILDTVYPLKDLLSDTIFNLPKKEQHVIETSLMHTCRNAIPYLHNQAISANVVIDKRDINIDCVYPDMLSLTRCTADELNDKKNAHRLNKVIKQIVIVFFINK